MSDIIKNLTNEIGQTLSTDLEASQKISSEVLGSPDGYSDEIKDLKTDMTDGDQLLLNMFQLDTTRLKTLTPYQPGRGYAIPIVAPKFMERYNEAAVKKFVSMVIAFATEITGIEDPTLNTHEITTGNENQKMAVATNWTALGSTISIKFPQELRGQFLLKFHRAWGYGIQDPNLGFGTYHGLAGRTEGDKLPYSNANHTMSMIFFTLDPSETYIENCYYILNMMPTNLQESINNKTRGENTPPEYTATYTAQIITNNEKIKEICYTYLNTITSARANGSTMLNTLGKDIEDLSKTN